MITELDDIVLKPRRVLRYKDLGCVLLGGIAYLEDGKPQQAAVHLGDEPIVTSKKANLIVKHEKERGVVAPVLDCKFNRLDTGE